MSTLTPSTKHCTQSPIQSIRQENITKGTNIEKEEIKLTLFTVDMVIYKENPKELTTKKLLVTNKQF